MSLELSFSPRKGFIDNIYFLSLLSWGTQLRKTSFLTVFQASADSEILWYSRR